MGDDDKIDLLYAESVELNIEQMIRIQYLEDTLDEIASIINKDFVIDRMLAKPELGGKSNKEKWDILSSKNSFLTASCIKDVNGFTFNFTFEGYKACIMNRLTNEDKALSSLQDIKINELLREYKETKETKGTTGQ